MNHEGSSLAWRRWVADTRVRVCWRKRRPAKWPNLITRADAANEANYSRATQRNKSRERRIRRASISVCPYACSVNSSLVALPCQLALVSNWTLAAAREEHRQRSSSPHRLSLLFAHPTTISTLIVPAWVTATVSGVTKPRTKKHKGAHGSC